MSVKFHQEEVSSTSEVESCKQEKKPVKTVTFNLNDTTKDAGDMTVIDDDKDIDNNSRTSSHHILANQEKNIAIQVRRVRQSIDLDSFLNCTLL